MHFFLISFQSFISVLWAFNQLFNIEEYNNCREAPPLDDNLQYIPQHKYYRGTECGANRIIRKGLIAQGSISKVYRAELRLNEVDKNGNALIINDIVIKVGMHQWYDKVFRREECLLANAIHPHIPKFYCALVYKGRPAIIMEYIKGELAPEIRDSRSPEEMQNVNVRWPEVLAVGTSILNFFHQNHLIIKDLKGSNILVGEKVYFFDYNLTDQLGKFTAEVGTAIYWPPEIACHGGDLDNLEKVPFTNKVDWYALGLVLFQMIQGFMPFNIDVWDVAMDEIVQGVEDKVPEGPLGELLSGLMNRNVDERFGLEKVCHWVAANGQAYKVPMIEECAQWLEVLNMETLPLE